MPGLETNLTDGGRGEQWYCVPKSVDVKFCCLDDIGLVGGI